MRYKRVALLTDFGLKDNFVGVVKGVILKYNPKIHIIDITNNISPQNIIEASLLLKNSYKHFPNKTIFLTIVDPGVGTERDIIVIKNKSNLFIAPDNGVLSFLQDEDTKLYRLTIPNRFIPRPESATFHGRDIFAPTAGLLSKGTRITKLCIPTNKIKKMKISVPVKHKNSITGKIIYIDSFGNCISNIDRRILDQLFNKKFSIKINKSVIKKISLNYQDINKIGALFNSFNLLEIAVPNGNASRKLKIKEGDLIKITF